MKVTAEELEMMAVEMADKVKRRRYRVHAGGRHWRRFATRESAKAYCEKVFERSKVVLAIVDGGEK